MAPKRKRVQRYDSEEVQGEDSWVLVAALTVAEARENQKRAVTEKNFDVIEVSVDVLKTHVYEWNWVDDDDKPLPQPRDDSSVIDELSIAEFNFLSLCIQGSEAEAKN